MYGNRDWCTFIIFYSQDRGSLCMEIGIGALLLFFYSQDRGILCFVRTTKLTNKKRSTDNKFIRSTLCHIFSAELHK